MSRLMVLRHGDQKFVDAFSKEIINDDQLQHDDCVYMPDGFDFFVFDILKQQKKFAPKLLVCDAGYPLEEDAEDFEILFVPDLKYGTVNFVRNFINSNAQPVKICATDRCFNFSVNIGRLDRSLMMKLISWFGLTSYCHSWRGDGVNVDMSPILAEMKTIKEPWLTKQLKNHLLSPVTEFKKQWVDIGSKVTVRSYGTLPGEPMKIAQPWIEAIAPMMKQTAVTLICESSNRPEVKSLQLSEKSMFSILSATFPIWIGTYAQADLMSKIGFDVFSDVIDHSYQYRSTLLERCYYAIHDNIEILKNIDLAKTLRKQHWQRLQHNQTLLLNENILGKYSVEQAKKLPLDIQERLVFSHDACTFPASKS